MSGTFGGAAAGVGDVGRIVDALQQMIKLQGLVYQLLLTGPSTVTVRPLLTAAANDAAAAAAGVAIGGLYQNAGAVRQRLV
jgi:hypothetical protein